VKKFFAILVLTLAVILASTPTTAFAGKPDGKGKPAQQPQGGGDKPEADYQTGGSDDSDNTGKVSDANNNDDNNSNGHQRNEWVVEEGSKAHNCDANGGHCVEAPEATPEPTPVPITEPEVTPTTEPELTPVPTPEPDITPNTTPEPPLVTPEPVTTTLTLPEDAGTCVEDCDPCELLEQILEEEKKQTELLEKIYSLLLRVVEAIL